MKHIAVDLGAESGRVIVGDLSGMEVFYRFPSRSYRRDGHLFWDIQGIFEEILLGMRMAFRQYGKEIGSVGIDTWGVDYVLLDGEKKPLEDPFHYRDDRVEGIMEELIDTLGRDFIYRHTGIQLLSINTIYQMVAEKRAHPEKIDAARAFLTIPDYLSFLLSGVAVNEFSNATTTQLYDTVNRTWAWELLERLELPGEIFGSVVQPGTVLGSILPGIAAEVGASPEVKIIAPACHDTGSAVAAVPFEGTGGNEGEAYLSSGTWSLLGYELSSPLISDESLAANFTNEGGVGGTTRFLKNISGLWVLQECRKEWAAAGEDLGYAEILDLAEETGGFDFTVDIDDPEFLKPGTKENPMTERVRSFCRDGGLPVPSSAGEVASVVFESLARCYADTIVLGDSVTGRKTGCLHIIGGGCRQRYLNRRTAERTGISVTAGPVEATALGNILMQARAMGTVDSILEGRKMIRTQFPFDRYGS